MDPLKAESFPGGYILLNLTRTFKAFHKLRHSPYGGPMRRVEDHSFLREPEEHTFFAERRSFYPPL